MAHFMVIFDDNNHDVHVNHFETFMEAQEYWDDYADVPTCIAGEMIDLDTEETIWEFDES